MEALEVWWRWAKNVAINHWVWIASIVATTGLALSPLVADQDARKVIVTIGSVVLASGIAGAVIRSSTFTDMFIARIVDVFYDGKHLRSRKDMKEICTRTLNALLESESPALRGAVGSELLNGYLDFKLGYIYRDFSVQIEVKDLDRTTGVMEILETTTAIIVPNPGVAQITLHWAWFSLGHTSAKAELLTISIDGDKVDLDKLRENDQASDNRGFSYPHALKNTSTDNENNGIVYVKRVKKFIDLRQDPVTIYKFRAPCLGMSVTLLDFPESDLECDVQAFGLPEEFRPDRNKQDLQGHWRNQKYSRLIFPRQGVMLQWNFLKKEQVQ